MQLGSLCSGPRGASTYSLAFGGLGLRQLDIDSCAGSLDGHALEVDGRGDGMPAGLRADDLGNISIYPHRRKGGLGGNRRIDIEGLSYTAYAITIAGIVRLRPLMRDTASYRDGGLEDGHLLARADGGQLEHHTVAGGGAVGHDGLGGHRRRLHRDAGGEGERDGGVADRGRAEVLDLELNSYGTRRSQASDTSLSQERSVVSGHVC